ncbi:MAG: DUF456 domain-containing protein [Pseudomonadota bacterium]
MAAIAFPEVTFYSQPTMWETISTWGGWNEASVAGAWLITACLLIIGLVGCFLPVIPGPLIILIAVVFHWLVLRQESGVEWWTFVVLVALIAASQVYDIVSGAAGSRWFGGTKWGAIGAIVGAIAGLFFLPLGLILGPLIGACTFELLFAEQDPRKAAVSGVGSAIGALSAVVVKVLIGLAMIVWFFVDVFFIGP